MTPRKRDVIAPAAVLAAVAAWYAADSLSHRRERGQGYELRGDVDPTDPAFMRVAAELTGAPVSQGNDIELLVNGDGSSRGTRGRSRRR